MLISSSPPACDPFTLSDLDHAEKLAIWFKPVWTKPVWTVPVSSPAPLKRSRQSLLSQSASSLDDDDECASPPPLESSRKSWQRHSRAYSLHGNFDSGRPPLEQFRDRSFSAPTFTAITEEGFSSEEEEVSTPSSLSETLDPFQLLLPYCDLRLEKARSSLDAGERVSGHVPAKSVQINAFKTRYPRVPRYQRPLVTIVCCALLFGTLCVVSFLQQSVVAREKTLVVHQGEWLIRNVGVVHTQAEDVEFDS